MSLPFKPFLVGLVLTGYQALVGSASGCGKSAPARDWAASPAVVTLAGTQEIDAVGDLHGDILVTARLLAAAGLITPSTPFHWLGGSRVLVITGDVIDKGTSALPIIDLLISLEPEARVAGGRVVVTLGNHESEFLADPVGSKSGEFRTELLNRGLDPGRVAAGASPYGAWLLSRPVAALVDGWFFCHAGHSAGMSAAAIAEKFQHLIEHPEPQSQKAPFDDPFLIGADSLLEAQLWWQKGGTGSANAIDLNLQALPASHIVFGHDPGSIAFPDDPQGLRERGQLVARYDGRIFLIDVGMSSAVGYSDGALLRIFRDPPERTAILFADGTSQAIGP